MTIRHDCIAAELTVLLVQPGGLPLPLEAGIRYEPDDPFAVTIDFRTGPDSMVTWTFARDLLRAGLDAPSGEGDVQVWPARLGRGPVSLEVSSPSGHALFELPRREVLAFLERAYSAVPLDAESQHFDVDAFLSTLTGRGSDG
jgi:hypothetical protein